MNLFIHHRDIRFEDNTTMIKQMQEEHNIIPIFIFDPIQIDPKKNSYFSNGFVQFMIESLKEYQKLLHKKKGEIYFFYGDTLDVLKYLHKKFVINSIGFNYEYSVFGKKRDENIIKFSNKNNIKIYCLEDVLLFDLLNGETLNPTTKKPFLVYTIYYNYLMKMKVREVNKYKKFIFAKHNDLKTCKYSFDNLDSLYEINPDINVHGGRSLALKILKNLKKFGNYIKCRDMLNYKTTMLSAYINLNLVSIREVYYSIVNTFDKHHGLVRELIFREYYHTLVHYYPQVTHGNFYPKFDKVKWTNNTHYFNSWCNAKTGYPIIDAAMTQIIKTNYMHNRMRMMVASFLIKNLQVDWRKGEKFFAQHLEDYNIFSNWGGWTNIADASPSAQSYFRVFSPEAHSRKYDPECEYIKYWLPELKDVPIEDIHSWERNYEKYLKQGIKYYPPIVEFSKTRDEFLKFYKKYQ